MHSIQPSPFVAVVSCAAPRSASLGLRAWLLVAACATGLAFGLPAAAQSAPFEPQVGQSGKDVIWVPTPNELVSQMLAMAGVTARDTVIDLGSGDGRTVIAAARLGANAMGIEYDPNMVSLSNANARAAGLAERARFIKADIFEYDFSAATVLTMYLLTDLNVRLRPKILQMKPGTRVVSHQFRMGDWEPDRTVRYDDRPAYLWIVPARVEGNWLLTVGNEQLPMRLQQSFQTAEGRISRGAVELRFAGVRLNGDNIQLGLPDGRGGERKLSGVVSADGNSIQGEAGGIPWSARRQ